MQDHDSEGFYMLIIFFWALFLNLVPLAWPPADRPPLWIWSFMIVETVVVLFLMIKSKREAEKDGSVSDKHAQRGQIRLIVDNTNGKPHE